MGLLMGRYRFMHDLKIISAFNVFLWLIIALILRYMFSYDFAMDVIIYSIAVLGFNVLYGYMNYLSFGNMAYIGLGSYIFVLSYKYISSDVMISALLAVMIPVLIALATGPIVLREGGAFFALTMFALNFVLWYLFAIQLAPITGGTAGMPFSLPKTPVLDISDREDRFVLTILVSAIVGVTYIWLCESVFGILLRAIKENERRIPFLGYNVMLIKLLAYIWSAFLSSLAGLLYAINYSYISPDIISPMGNLQLVVASVIGGSGTYLGALVGSLVVIGLKDIVSAWILRWEAILGAASIIIVLLFRKGFIGFLRDKVAVVR